MWSSVAVDLSLDRPNGSFCPLAREGFPWEIQWRRAVLKENPTDKYKKKIIRNIPIEKKVKIYISDIVFALLLHQYPPIYKNALSKDVPIMVCVHKEFRQFAQVAHSSATIREMEKIKGEEWDAMKEKKKCWMRNEGKRESAEKTAKEIHKGFCPMPKLSRWMANKVRETNI